MFAEFEVEKFPSKNSKRFQSFGLESGKMRKTNHYFLRGMCHCVHLHPKVAVLELAKNALRCRPYLGRLSSEAIEMASNVRG